MKVPRFLYSTLQNKPTELAYCLMFGLLSILFSLVQLNIKNYENVLTDLREIPLLISIFYFRNPLSIILLCLLALVSVLPFQSFTYWPMFISHLFSLLIIWVAYQSLLKVGFKNWILGLAWAGVNLTYYLILIIPLLIVTYRIFGIDSGHSFVSEFLNIVISAKFEIAATALVTSIYLIQFKLRELLEFNQIELGKINRSLIQTNKDLDNFIYTASHELVVPITNIEASVNLLNSTDVSKQDTNKIHLMILDSVHKFKDIVGDLNDISKVQQLRDIDKSKNDFHDVVNGIIKKFNNEIESINCEIRTDFSQCPSVEFSRKSLVIIIENIISNAIKYRDLKRKLRILIKTEDTDSFCILSVNDNGLGINKNYQDKIFFMFKRAHVIENSKGIGLYIVKRIIENEGGKIEVDSEVGKGSTFNVFF